jgi:hypothetical protein
MRKYPKKLGSGKLDKPATMKNCGTISPLHEIAKRPYGTLNGAWCLHGRPDGLPCDHVGPPVSLLMPFITVAGEGGLIDDRFR